MMDANKTYEITKMSQQRLKAFIDRSFECWEHYYFCGWHFINELLMIRWQIKLTQLI